MRSPDPYTALYLTGPQWHRTLGDQLRGDLIYFWGEPHERHPFAERMLKAVFDACGISRDEHYRNYVFQGLCSELAARSMKSVAKKGVELPFVHMSLNGRSWTTRPNFVEWSRSSTYRANLCLTAHPSGSEEERAQAGFRCEIQQVASIMTEVMDSIYRDVECFHDAHRPHWEVGGTGSSSSVD